MWLFAQDDERFMVQIQCKAQKWDLCTSIE